MGGATITISEDTYRTIITNLIFWTRSSWYCGEHGLVGTTCRKSFATIDLLHQTFVSYLLAKMLISIGCQEAAI